MDSKETSLRQRPSRREESPTLPEGVPPEEAYKYNKKGKLKFIYQPDTIKFNQQKLKAWQPVLTPLSVLPPLFVIGALFLIFGGVMLYGSNKVKNFTIDYTQCEFQAPNTSFQQIPSDYYSYKGPGTFAQNIDPPSWRFRTQQGDNVPIDQENVCTVQFTVPQEMESPVFLYYRMTHFYQNHRRYLQSLDGTQLQGKYTSLDYIRSSPCDPANIRDGKVIYPCGLIANSYFNDSYTEPRRIADASGSAAQETYPMTDRNIAPPEDAKRFAKTVMNYTDVVPPPYWAKKYPNGYTEDGTPTAIPNLANDTHFHVWMRTALLSTFDKLYYRNDDMPMPAGRYEIDIYMNYPVAMYKGTKQILFSTVSFVGGRNNFFGIVFIVTGAIMIVLSIALTTWSASRPRRLGNFHYLSWNKAN